MCSGSSCSWGKPVLNVISPFGITNFLARASWGSRRDQSRMPSGNANCQLVSMANSSHDLSCSLIMEAGIPVGSLLVATGKKPRVLMPDEPRWPKKYLRHSRIVCERRKRPSFGTREAFLKFVPPFWPSRTDKLVSQKIDSRI